MSTSRVAGRAGLVLAMCALPAFGQVVVLDFDSPEGGGGLLNGQAVNAATVLPFVEVQAVPSDDNLGNAIFDSDPDGPNMAAMDQDLLVDSGNILMLQNPDFPDHTVPGIFDHPNDSLHGGTTVFTFLPEGGVSLHAIDIIDLDHAESVILRVTRIGGDVLVIDLPADFTGNGGQRTVEFEPEGTLGVDGVVSLEVETHGSGAVDNLVFAVASGKECNADAMCEDGILCTADVCADGICVNEAIPGCDTCQEVQLFLEADAGLIGPGEVLTVDVVMSCTPEPVVGAQFFLDYDPFDLTFISATPGDPPFEVEIFEEVDGVNGLIDYAVHIPFDGTAGDSGPAVLATLVFVATNDCGQTQVRCRDNNPPTRLSTEGGGEILPQCNDADIRVACPSAASGEDGQAPRVKSRRARRKVTQFPGYGRTIR